MTAEEVGGKTKQNIIEETITEMISSDARSRLSNIKSVALERYYKIEQLLYDIYTIQRIEKITDAEFLKILQATEKPKKTFVYTKRYDLLDELD
ncbi:hypothetical protein NEMIN01_0560 [Nematocida minor]|uniref:uncharacterized protein n=1 Tax=Nematocida minor TaxID=1912983 RepID=UPI00221FEE47|nr:uncharacterized protein NEMIN01_0560 [Nematocida minor]KAI5189607.1 hypothetical protein NEMIN01_0560 [Nematocida minor]